MFDWIFFSLKQNMQIQVLSLLLYTLFLEALGTLQ